MSHHRRRIPDHLHAERLVPRYTVARAVDPYTLNERQRLALKAISTTFRRERGRDLVAGDVASALGDGQGWTAEKTVDVLRRHALVNGQFEGYSITNAGLEVLRALDASYEHDERCGTCRGRGLDETEWWEKPSSPDAFYCPPCRSTGLRVRAPNAIPPQRWIDRLQPFSAEALKR